VESLAFKLSRMLVAVDGSMYSDYALNVAVKIAERYSSGIELVYVETRSGTAGQSPINKGENVLGSRVEIVKERNLPCNPINIESNDPAGEILKLANSKNYDIVVLGSRGLGGVKSLLMGSVSNRVAKEAKSSVLVVKTRIAVNPKLLLGYDGSEESNKALEFATDLGEKLSAQVDVVTVFNIPVSPEAYIGAEFERWEKEMHVSLESAINKIKSAGLKSQGKILDHTNVSVAIVTEAEKGAYDFIVVGSRGLGRLKSLFLGSVASGIANSSKTNVLIVR
jgi:nucleotide-binding universal stress UspA family protein